MPGIVTANDRLKAGIEKIIRAVFGPRIDYMVPQYAVVKAQNADGSVDVLPDDARYPGLQGVPIDTGIPGVSFTIQVGARVQLVFVGGDPSKPRVTEWNSASVQTVTVNAGTVNVVGSTVNVNASTVNVGGSSSTQVNLGPGPAYQLVARMTDPVVAGPFAGSILTPAQAVTKA